MVQYGGLSVRILINGVPCTEYDVPDPDPEVIDSLPPSKSRSPQDDKDGEKATDEIKTSAEPVASKGSGKAGSKMRQPPPPDTNISKFVQIETGACFEIECRVFEGFDLCSYNTIVYEIFLDGKRLMGKLLVADENGRLRKTCVTCDRSYLADGMSAQQLKFGQIVTRGAVSSDDMTQLKVRLAGLGTIKVQACRANSVFADSEPNWSKMKSPVDGGIPENALKGRSLSSHTDFGDVIQGHGSARLRKYEKRESPDIATFHLRYRSKMDLQILGIVPRSPSPEYEDNDNLDKMPPEKLKALLRQMNGKQEADMRMKQEKTRAGSLVSSAGAPSAQSMRGLKRPRIPMMDEDDEILIVGESPVRRRARPPPQSEVIYISD